METTVVQSYNIAIQYLQEEQFEEASPLLKAIIKEYPSFIEAKWALGMLYVLSGFPYQALQLWANIEDTELLSYKQMVEEKTSLYDELYEKYSQALELAQAEEMNQAKNIFEELLSFQTEVPLPIDFYHGYLLILLVEGETESVQKEINHFPLYVKNSSVILELEKMLVDYQSAKPVVEGKTTTNKGGPKHLFIASSLAASLLIGGVGMRGFGQQKEVDEVKPVIQQQAIAQITDKYEKEIAVSKEQSGELDKQQELNDITYLGEKTLSTKASLNACEKGLIAFRNKDYKKAVSHMERSLFLQPNEYFSDDALFFLIESKQRLNEKENILSIYDHFLSQTSNHFVFSPYKDDLLLGKAKILIEDGNTKDALPFLEKILTDYKQEWTSVEAALMINQIKALEKT